MKILYIIESLSAGGKERRLVELIKGLKDYPDIQCELAIMSNDIHYQYIFKQDIRVHYLIRNWKKDPRIFFKLYKLCKEFKPDIIHSWGSMPSVYALPSAKLLRIKFINGSITYAATLKIFSKLWLISKITFPFSDIILANSKAGLKTHNLKESDKNLYIYNGFDFSRLNDLSDRKSVRERFNIKSKYIVGMVANFLQAKDYETYLRSAEKILEKRKDVTFLCVGEGQNLKKSKEFVNEKFYENIKFLGKQKEIESIVNIFDIGILTCNTNGHAEGISNSIMEYMALGKPVIATDSGGNKEIVIDNKTGFIVQSFNIEEVVGRVNELLNDKSKRVRMGKAGRKRIENEFNLNKMIVKFVEAYKTICWS